jgi:hypothetical protein
LVRSMGRAIHYSTLHEKSTKDIFTHGSHAIGSTAYLMIDSSMNCSSANNISLQCVFIKSSKLQLKYRGSLQDSTPPQCICRHASRTERMMSG